MKDYLGQELQPGDEVIYLEHTKTSSCYCKGKIAKLTEKTVFVERYPEEGRYSTYVLDGVVRKDSDKIIKISALKG